MRGVNQGLNNLPNTVTEIGSYAMYGYSNITSLTVPENLTIIGSYAFAECANLATLVVQGNSLKISNYGFNHCGLTSITGNILEFGEYSFSSCNSLNEVEIYGTVKNRALQSGNTSQIRFVFTGPANVKQYATRYGANRYQPLVLDFTGLGETAADLPTIAGSGISSSKPARFPVLWKFKSAEQRDAFAAKSEVHNTYLHTNSGDSIQSTVEPPFPTE